MLVVADEHGFAIDSEEEMKYYAEQLYNTCERLTNEDIYNINEGLLGNSHSGIWSDIYKKTDDIKE